MEFTKDTKLRQIVDAPVFAPANRRLISSAADYFAGEMGELTLEGLQGKNPTWNHKDIIYGLYRLQEVAQSGVQYVYPLYGPEETAADPELQMGQLYYLPARERKYRAFALLMAGGAYGAVCTMGESLPVAARLNELGVTCFCLNYRTAAPESFAAGLMPKPLDDVAAAWRLIRANAARFDVDPACYAAGGFSAGGHLAAMWGTAHMGARKYDLPNPKLLLLAYPMVSLEAFQASPVTDYIKTGLLGNGYAEEDVRRYSVHRHIDSAYPPVYLVMSLDDGTVALRHSQDLERVLHSAGVPSVMERVGSGGHGFGLGSATPADGWVERAWAFGNSLGVGV